MTFADAVPVLFDVLTRYGARPDIPIGAEDFFTALVAQFNDPVALRQHLVEPPNASSKSLEGGVYLDRWAKFYQIDSRYGS